MVQTVDQVMTPAPVCLAATTAITDAARIMRDQGIGDVLVNDDGELSGIVTDRDIVVRAIAGGLNPETATIKECCSPNIVTVRPDQAADQVVWLMRERALRRIPVVDNGIPVGIVSIGDMAVERDSSSALSDISAAPPNT